jgi:tetratricopeptide (TPR) repeat protein
MDGQGAIAIQAGRDYARMVKGGEFYQALAQLRFGRFEDLLDLHSPPENPIYRGLWDFGRGYAHLRLEHADSARFYLARVRTAAEHTPATVSFRGHSAAQLLGVVGGILDGEIRRADGRLDDAIASFERAVEIEDGLTYDEPEPLNFSARDWLGAALLEADRAQDAERTYRLALEDHPHNGWALFGLEAALRTQGRTVDADAARTEFERAWARSDVWLRASRF